MWNARLSCLGGWIIPLALNLNESSPEDGLRMDSSALDGAS